MAIKTKEIKIGDHTVSILQFNALEALKLRKELVGAIKKQVGDISLGGDNVASIVKGVAGLVYEVPAEMYMDLFKNCSKKVPMLKPMEDAIKQALNDAKSV